MRSVLFKFTASIKSFFVSVIDKRCVLTALIDSSTPSHCCPAAVKENKKFLKSSYFYFKRQSLELGVIWYFIRYEDGISVIF